MYVCIYIHTYRIHTGPWAAAPRTHRRCQPLAIYRLHPLCARVLVRGEDTRYIYIYIHIYTHIYRLHPLCTRVLVRALALSDFCGETRDIYTYNTPTHTHTHPHTQTCSRQSAIRFLRENAIYAHYIYNRHDETRT